MATEVTKWHLSDQIMTLYATYTTLAQQANYNWKIPTHWFTLTPYSNQDQQHEKWKIIKTLKCEQTNSYLWLILNIWDNQIVNWHTMTTSFTLFYIRATIEILLDMVLRCKTYTFHCKIKQMWLYKATKKYTGVPVAQQRIL